MMLIRSKEYPDRCKLATFKIEGELFEGLLIPKQAGKKQGTVRTVEQIYERVLILKGRKINDQARQNLYNTQLEQFMHTAWKQIK